MRLSVLDQSPISEGSTGAEALANTIDLARLADALGYQRYWVAEHHGTPMLASSSPEVLIGPIASATSRIRVGSGGVMLPHYSPLKVAENFSMLEGLSGADRSRRRTRRRHRPAHCVRASARPPPGGAGRFPRATRRIARRTSLARSRPVTPSHALASSLPGRPRRPEPWLLGSSPQSGIWAAEAGLPYAFADFINPAGAEIAARYRRDFTAVGVADGTGGDCRGMGGVRGR